MKFKIYSKTNCPYCYKVKQVMELTSSDFIEYTLDKDFTRTEFYDKFGKGSVQGIDFGHGNINPSMWGYKTKEKKKKRNR